MQTSPSYTGDVKSGGPSDVRVLPGLIIRKASVGPMDNNAYLLTCTKTGAQLLIDAANDAPRLLQLLSEDGASPQLETIVTTHQHFDHHCALVEMVEQTSARTAAGADDAAGIPVARYMTMLYVAVHSVGDVSLDVIALRGHTPDSVELCFAVPYDTVPVRDDDQWSQPRAAHIFICDSLFP